MPRHDGTTRRRPSLAQRRRKWAAEQRVIERFSAKAPAQDSVGPGAGNSTRRVR